MLLLIFTINLVLKYFNNHSWQVKGCCSYFFCIIIVYHRYRRKLYVLLYKKQIWTCCSITSIMKNRENNSLSGIWLLERTLLFILRIFIRYRIWNPSGVSYDDKLWWINELWMSNWELNLCLHYWIWIGIFVFNHEFFCK